ncbi:hypothetical protein PR048_016750 [Dryococelus australis]|uniref:Uncharacterized protein n=1 Tax=Dryococelus australis TaxID=614101 RepID=A0ABQ9H7K6_9NEOP|nr:hypothetical protein PR048_016750 [Dryococelus australis]
MQQHDFFSISTLDYLSDKCVITSWPRKRFIKLVLATIRCNSSYVSFQRKLCCEYGVRISIHFTTLCRARYSRFCCSRIPPFHHSSVVYHATLGGKWSPKRIPFALTLWSPHTLVCVTPDFHRRESCRTMPVGFLGALPFPPALSFWHCSILTSIALISSQDLDVKSRPNFFTHLLTLVLSKATGVKIEDQGHRHPTGRPGKGLSCWELSRSTCHRTPDLLHSFEVTSMESRSGSWVKVTCIQYDGRVTSHHISWPAPLACVGSPSHPRSLLAEEVKLLATSSSTYKIMSEKANLALARFVRAKLRSGSQDLEDSRNEHAWTRIAEEFKQKWDYPNCIGAANGGLSRHLYASESTLNAENPLTGEMILGSWREVTRNATGMQPLNYVPRELSKDAQQIREECMEYFTLDTHSVPWQMQYS